MFTIIGYHEKSDQPIAQPGALGLSKHCLPHACHTSQTATMVLK